MPAESTAIAIGLTGAFGSGCTTAAKHLRDNRDFHYVLLSQAIKDRWNREHPGEQPERGDLQRLGDLMRSEDGSGVLVEAALQQLNPTPKRVVFDGIRNLGEVRALEERYGYRFLLIAVMASQQERWDRIGQQYTDTGRTQVDFIQDDERDRNEEIETGQQVELCVDRSDVFINSSSPVDIGAFKQKVLDYIDLVTGTVPRAATQEEILMNMAYGSSHSSKCIKRHVGAIVVDKTGHVVGVGYNENPLGTKPCIEEPEYDRKCYRDIVRNEHFASLADRGARCPVCGERLSVTEGPPWRCRHCAENGVKTNLENFYFPDRAMSWCTAIHAEVWAVLVAGSRAIGGTVYTTTFPCFQCAEKIVQAGIKSVVYTEVYPDVKGELRFKLAGIELHRFEGVRSSSFQRIFDPVRPR